MPPTSARRAAVEARQRVSAILLTRPARMPRASGGAAAAASTTAAAAAAVPAPVPVHVPAPASLSQPDLTATCSVCLQELNVKRVTTLRPCRHHFHESCVATWLETREYRREQTCPLCRAYVQKLVDDSGRTTMPGFPYGATGQPTYLRLGDANLMQLHELLRDTESRLARCVELLRDESKGDEYKLDLQAEKTQMEARRDTLQRLQSQQRQSRAALSPVPQVARTRSAPEPAAGEVRTTAMQLELMERRRLEALQAHHQHLFLQVMQQRAQSEAMLQQLLEMQLFQQRQQQQAHQQQQLLLQQHEAARAAAVNRIVFDLDDSFDMDDSFDTDEDDVEDTVPRRSARIAAR
ncbi:hypothetical protein PMAYCL1PPCAC_01050, partial [Pristionchus mayeri]